jgi:hypothetical protein
VVFGFESDGILYATRLHFSATVMDIGEVELLVASATGGRGTHFCRRRPLLDGGPPFNYTQEFALHLRKIIESLSPGSRGIQSTVHPIDFDRLVMHSTDGLLISILFRLRPQATFGHPSVGASVFQVPRTSKL